MGNEYKNAVEYRAWYGMQQRCTNTRHPYYADYGARGITVCDRWKSFTNFLEDMGQCPAGLTLERKDNEQGYSPENCEWATRHAQQNNRRNTVFLTHEGKTQPLSVWAKELGINPKTLSGRLHRFGNNQPEKVLNPHVQIKRF